MWRLVLGLVVGGILGSLVECLAIRSTTKESFWGRSYCLSCKKKLRWYDLIPFFSFVFLGGRCRNCHTEIPFTDFLMEVLTALLVGLIFLKYLPVDWLTHPLDVWILIDLAFKVFVVCVVLITLITDLRRGLIPDRITYPAIKISLLYLILTSAYKIFFFYNSVLNSSVGQYLLPPYSDFVLRQALFIAQPLFSSLLTAFFVGLFFFGLIRITNGRGMGGGDLKLSIFLGLALGGLGTLLALIVAFLVGSLVGLLLILARKKTITQTIPFGPFLSLGAVLAVVFGQDIINWYFKFRLA